MATLHLMVGLPCSGKTTYAKKLEMQEKAVRFTPDVWQIKLFGQDARDEKHDERHSAIEAIMWETAKRTLELGTSVILDFGFWAKEERDFFKLEAERLNADFKIHFMDVPSDELLARLEKRNANAGDDVFVIEPAELEKWIGWFEAPDADELR